MEGIRIESLLHLAAWNRENERADAPRTPAKVAPLNEVLNHDRPQLLPLSEIAPQLPGLHNGKRPLQASLQYITDPQNALVLAPLGHSSNGEALPALTSSRLPTLSTITNPPSKPTKSGAPLKEVLNDEDCRSPNLSKLQQAASSRRSSVSSGPARKRRKLSNTTPTSLPSATATIAGPGLTLPKPQPRVRKEGRRNRIPPVISGLHDPPQDAVLLPSIATSAVNRNWISGLPASNDRVTHGDGNREQPTKPVAAVEEDPSHEPEMQPASASQPVPDDAECLLHEEQEEQEEQVEQVAETTTPPEHPQKSKRNSRRAKGAYRRWSEEEGEDLVAGVKRFGIGAWKKILKCADYHFDDRTAVDLKDRFRRCFPEEYRHAGQKAAEERDPKDAPSAASPPEDQGRSHGRAPAQTGKASSAEKQAEDVAQPEAPPEPEDSVDAEGLFKRRKRRGRMRFTEQEDDAIYRGFQKYGSKWNKIRKDAELNLGHRSGLDIRDRFRNKWPDILLPEGRKKRTDEHDNEEQITAPPDEPEHNRDTTSVEPPAHLQPRSEPPTSQTSQPPPNSAPTEPQAASTIAQQDPKPATLFPLLPSTTQLPFPPLELDSLTDFDAEDDGDPEPITLRRDIFEYLPLHTSSSQQATQAATAAPNVLLDNPLLHSLDRLFTNLPSGLKPSASTSAGQQNLPSTALSGMPLAGMLSDDLALRSVSGADGRAVNAMVSLPGLDYLTMALDDETRVLFW